jgi:hypothetical protein
MRLDRNNTEDGTGKYVLVNMRRVHNIEMPAVKSDITRALKALASYGVVDLGEAGSADEFFVIKLKDKYAEQALAAYASAAVDDDPEYAKEVSELASKAATHPFKKRPD